MPITRTSILDNAPFVKFVAITVYAVFLVATIAALVSLLESDEIKPNPGP